MQTFKTPFQPKVKTLETERLSIRIDTEEEYVHMFRTASDEDIRQRYGIMNDTDLETQKAKVRGGLSTYRTSVVFFHLKARALDKVVGSFAFHNWYAMHRRSEIGYAMAGEYRNKGYMSEAAPAIVAFGFKAMELNRLEAFIHPENLASRKIVEQLGFSQEGWLCEHYCNNGIVGDSLVYGLLLKDRQQLP